MAELSQSVAPATPQVKKFDENTLDGVLARINTFTGGGNLHLSSGYCVENAVRSAWLVLKETKDKNGKFALDVCTRDSIANALLEMVIKGLSVVKKQGYFIVYDTKLVFEESYMGTISIAKRDAYVSEVNGNVIYEDDVFEYSINPQTGRNSIINHTQKIQNIDPNKLIGAYAVINFNDGSSCIELMSMQQIRQSWKQRAGGAESPAHRNFPDQMAIKTVINRALKIKIGSSDDSEVMKNSPVQESVAEEIKENSGTKALPKAPQRIEIPAPTSHTQSVLVEENAGEEAGF